MQKILNHREQPIPTLRAVRPEIPQALDDICQRMMAKRPSERMAMTEVIDELAAFLERTAGPSTVSLQQAQVATRSQAAGGSKKPPFKLLAAGLGGLSALVLLAVVLIIRDKEGKETARINLPAGSSVTVQPADAKLANPTPEKPPLEPNGPVKPEPMKAETAKIVPMNPETVIPPPLNTTPLPDKPITLPETSANSTLAEPVIRPRLAFENPDFQMWVKEVARRQPEIQIALVVRKLRELNHGYDGQETHRIQNLEVLEFRCSALQITDLSPVRAFKELEKLQCTGLDSGDQRGLLSTLAPLRGMKLRRLDCYYTRVADLEPLREMSLQSLGCFGTNVANLAPLRGMPLTMLWCYEIPVADLSPLAGMPLTLLDVGNTRVTDLQPLVTCTKLKSLSITGNNLTADKTTALKQALPQCKIEWRNEEHGEQQE